MKKFKHSTSIQIRFKDVDKMGHINNANHLTYFELARMKYFTDVIKQSIDWEKEGFILGRIEINYQQPILLIDKIFVLSKCTRFGTKSFDISHSIVKEVLGKDGNSTGQIEVANGLTVLICYDYTMNKSINIPEDWKRKIELFEN